MVRRCFYNHFSSLPYTDSELHIVDSRLRAKGVVDPTAVGQNESPTGGRHFGNRMRSSTEPLPTMIVFMPSWCPTSRWVPNSA